MQFEDEVAARHAKVAELIRQRPDGWLEEIETEILRLDQQTMNIDGAGDQAEIARQVLTVLVDRLRGFSAGSRNEVRRDQKCRAELPMGFVGRICVP